MIVLYGISNCDTVKKARKWLEEQGVVYSFHDFRADGLTEGMLASWLEDIAMIGIVNRRSTTWRGLDEEQHALLENGDGVDIILAQPTIIKRPVLEKDGKFVAVGFKEDTYIELLK